MVASRWWDSSPAPTGIPWSPDVTTPAPGSEFACACNCPAVQAVDCTGRNRVVAYCPWGDKLSWFAAGLGCIQLLRWLKWIAWSVVRGYARSIVNTEFVVTPAVRPVEFQLPALGGGPVTPSELKRRRHG